MVDRDAAGKLQIQWDDEPDEFERGKRFYVSDEVKALAFGDAQIRLEPLDETNSE